VSGWLNDRNSGFDSWVYDNIEKYFATTVQLNALVNGIVNSCAAFAPAVSGWQRYCEAVIASAIVAESTYDPTAGTVGDDPTVGLLQVRFSSTVQDYNTYGSFEKIAAIGCAWPDDVKNRTGSPVGADHLPFMKSTGCNIGLAAWYYFINATGNGGSSAVYAYQYCQGKGVAGTMVIGLLSHLMGPAGPHPPDPSDSYVTGIEGRFDKLIGGPPSPHPFTDSLPPEQSKFCR
jgi:hypothetical protein